MIAAVGVVAVVVVVTIAGGLFVFAKEQPLPRVTPAPSLLGQVVPTGEAKHVLLGAPLEVTPGQPPAGGPHFAQPAALGVNARPVEDGNAIHSLGHGIVCISYRPDLVTAKALEVLAALAQAHGRDVLLSPRAGNASAVSVVSWGRRLNLAWPVPAREVEAFVVTNVNQAPEPGVR